MVICPECTSINVKVSSGNFARVKKEGEPAAKHISTVNFFLCWDCSHSWKSNGSGEEIYYEYCSLRDRTTLQVFDVRRDGSYHKPQHINANDLMRRIELAKLLKSTHRHDLDLSPSEWHEIEQDA